MCFTPLKFDRIPPVLLRNRAIASMVKRIRVKKIFPPVCRELTPRVPLLPPYTRNFNLFYISNI